jgi:hypothetical protein
MPMATGESREVRDPFASKPSRWPYAFAIVLIFAAAAAAWYSHTAVVA